MLVELKQWSSAEPVGDDLVQVPQYPEPVLHPVEQVRRYCEYLVDSTPALAEQPGAVHGLAYLHNALESGVWRLSQYGMDDYGRLYTMDTRSRMADHLKSLLDPDPAARDAAGRAAEDLLNARHAPSKPLLDLAAREIQDREQFVLIDEQQVAYSSVMQAVERARTSRTQTVVIVLGGPGSGKSVIALSVIALSLLGELARLGRRVYHATGSSAFTNTLRQLAGRRAPWVRNMFKYFNSFMDAEPRGLDVLICDEAHRVRETSVNRYTKAEARQRARRQVAELIDAAWVPVFLLDEHQVVRPGEMGSQQQIEAAARAPDCEVEVVHLAGQYRCGGSEFFDAWAAGLLDIGRRRATAWSDIVTRDDEDFVVHAASTPVELEDWLLAHTYKVLLTRGMRGVCVYSTDPETQEYLEKMAR
ncbi:MULTISPECIES: DNA/RNA helicase domain-containing protein [Saccharothrix]|uniref:DNA/RNA helicase domain-containing protein n=1 Tax=Saccharothrix TaxID=2071 RepID=UPI00095B2612|nr:DNA/RNA helicase domain-containing protein [Saccharothrix sp. CB00851]OKI30344.1 hypothetical protein A6A25_29235 [Saccharothrix sp. CB00851]